MAPHTAVEIPPGTVPERLTAQSISKRRAASGTLVAGVGAPADVAQFKGRSAHLHKAKARRWDRMQLL